MTNMFSTAEEPERKANDVVASLSSAAVNKAHNKHIHIDHLKELGINVVTLEDDQGLQDALMSVHHAFAHTLSGTTALKIVESHEGKAAVRHMQAPAPTVQFGAPG